MYISLKTDENQITLGIKNVLRSSINSALHLAAMDVRQGLMSMIDGLFTSSPEYQSLLGGDLQAEFGLADASAALDSIKNALQASVNVSVVPVATIGTTLRGGLNINMIRSTFEDLLSLPEASYQGNNFEVPWLDWLLMQGDRIIVAGYHITYNLSDAQQRNSMSGVAIMEKGGGWRVPPRFAGTPENNWITRTFAVEKIQKYIDNLVQQSIFRRLR